MIGIVQQWKIRHIINQDPLQSMDHGFPAHCNEIRQDAVISSTAMEMGDHQDTSEAEIVVKGQEPG